MVFVKPRDTTSRFGVRLRELRQARSLTLRQLAERTGVDFSYLSKVENGKVDHTPSVKTLQALARALDADELELMELANKMPPLLQSITSDPDARRFLRRASETIRGPEGWRELLEYLDRRDPGAGDEES